jgi:outer membrane protein TolC
MSSKTTIVWAIALVSLPVAAGAQTLISLREAVMLAVRHDARVLDAEAKEERARREADVSRAAFGPNLFTGTGAVYTYGYPQTPGGGAPSVFNLAFTQTLFDGPAKGQQRAAGQRIEVRRLDAARVREATILETALTYLELAGVRQSLDRQRTARRSAEEMIGLMRERLQEGRVLPLNVLEVRLSSARLNQRITQLEGRQETLESQLTVLTGLSFGSGVQVGAGDLPSLPDRSGAELVALAATADPTLQAARSEREAREHNLAGMRRRYWPSVELVGNYAVFSRFNNLDTFFSRFQRHSVNVGVEARVPLFAAATGPSVALARTELVEADVAIKQQQDRIELEVHRAVQAARQAAADLLVEELQLAVAQENVRVANVRADEGRADRLDLQRAIVEEARTWDEFYRADFERQRAQLQLRQLTGELSRLFP